MIWSTRCLSRVRNIDQGQDCYEERNGQRVLRQLAQHAEKLGMKVVTTEQPVRRHYYESIVWAVFLESGMSKTIILASWPAD